MSLMASVGWTDCSRMTNRQIEYIVKDQKPVILSADDTVRSACRLMRERGAGSVLIVNRRRCLSGIFTGRDAVRLLAKGADADHTPLAQAMTRNPAVVGPKSSAIDALRVMAERDCRHVPVAEDATIYGVVSRRDLKGMELEEFVRRETGRATSAALDRRLTDVIGNAKPFTLSTDKTVQEACRSMRRRKCGYVLVFDGGGELKGIFTGRDAVRVIAEGKDAARARLSSAMTRNPVTISSTCRAIEALRIMNDGGWRHLPVVGNGKVLGVVTRGDFTGIEVDRLDEEEHLKECIW
jgi:CBS domain-containing protein